MVDEEPIYIKGPNLVDSAKGIIEFLNGKKILNLYIKIHAFEISELHPALTLLRGHFNHNAIIYVSTYYSDAFSISSQTIKMLESASGVKVHYVGSGAGQMKIISELITALTGAK
jgi:hypothetical protein